MAESKYRLKRSKRELVQKFELFQKRLNDNPLVARKFKLYCGIQLEFFKSRLVNEKDLNYGFAAMAELWDQLIAWNELKDDIPTRGIIQELQEQHLDAALTLTPEKKEKQKIDLVSLVSKSYGSMKDA